MTSSKIGIILQSFIVGKNNEKKYEKIPPEEPFTSIPIHNFKPIPGFTILLFTLVAVEIVFGICHESCLYLAHTLLQNVAVWNNYNTILIMTVLT